MQDNPEYRDVIEEIYFNPKNKALVEEALKKARRFDLIGSGEKCLINSPNKYSNQTQNKRGQRKKGKKYEKR